MVVFCDASYRSGVAGIAAVAIAGGCVVWAVVARVSTPSCHEAERLAVVLGRRELVSRQQQAVVASDAQDVGADTWVRRSQNTLADALSFYARVRDYSRLVVHRAEWRAIS